MYDSGGQMIIIQKREMGRGGMSGSGHLWSSTQRILTWWKCDDILLQKKHTQMQQIL